MVFQLRERERERAKKFCRILKDSLKTSSGKLYRKDKCGELMSLMTTFPWAK